MAKRDYKYLWNPGMLLHYFLFTIATWGICSQPGQNKKPLDIKDSYSAFSDVIYRNKVDSMLPAVKTGDILLRSGTGADSYLVAMMNVKDKTYSHCGIVIIEDGYPFVYHCIGGEDNPDARMRRDSLVNYLAPGHTLGFGLVRYDLDSIHICSVKQQVYKYYAAKTKFDLKFDLKSDDQLYCSELVYKVINKAMKDTEYIKLTHAFGHTFVSLDNLFINPHAHFICKVQY